MKYAVSRPPGHDERVMPHSKGKPRELASCERIGTKTKCEAHTVRRQVKHHRQPKATIMAWRISSGSKEARDEFRGHATCRTEARDDGWLTTCNQVSDSASELTSGQLVFGFAKALRSNSAREGLEHDQTSPHRSWHLPCGYGRPCR